VTKHPISVSVILFLLLLSLFFPAHADAQEPAQQPAADAPQQTSQPVEVLSAFESYVNETLAADPGIPQRLRQFGHDLFKDGAKFDPTDMMPVGPSYLLGPGDELKVNIWGKYNTSFSAVIERDGKVNLGELGTIQLAGLTFADAKNYLESELGRYYKPSEVRMNVSLGALSSMRVFVLGKAENPGSYNISSMSTVLNALIAAGGPSKSGSMREIRVNRNGKTVATFDLYDLLLHGDKSGDMRLMPDDVVFIPPVGSLIAVAGYVRSPGIYEIKGETTASEIIGLAGGRNELAFAGRLKIDRISDEGKIVSLESRLDDPQKDAALKPGDLITVFNVVSERKLARVSGAVSRDGVYGVNDGLTVSGLISLAGGMRPYAYGKDAELTRVTPTPAGPETTKVIIDLEKALKGDPAHDIEIRQDDYLFVRTVPEWQLYRTVTIKGEVRFPGTYTIEKGETVHSLITRAGGFTDKAYLKGAFFTRGSVRVQQQKQLDEYAMRLEYELLAASSEAIEAALNPAAAEQMKIATEQKKVLLAKIKAARATGRVTLAMEPFEKFKGSAHDIALEDGDELHIPETPGQVQVIGSVYNQSAFVYTPDTTVSDYLKDAGGFTANADDDEIYILKVNGTAVSKRNSNGWRSFEARKLDAGDTIVVPEKVEKVVWLREIKDITQILYQIAVTAGVLIVAF